jgi:hypothetical protein
MNGRSVVRRYWIGCVVPAMPAVLCLAMAGTAYGQAARPSSGRLMKLDKDAFKAVVEEELTNQRPKGAGDKDLVLVDRATLRQVLQERFKQDEATPEMRAAQDRAAMLNSLTLTLQSQLELYKLQHRDQPPTLAQMQEGMSVLLKRTDEKGEVSEVGRFGPYLVEAATNPLTGSAKVVPAGKPELNAGWTYDEGSGKVRPIVPKAFPDRKSLPEGEFEIAE